MAIKVITVGNGGFERFFNWDDDDDGVAGSKKKRLVYGGGL